MILNQGWKFNTLAKQLHHWENIGFDAADVLQYSGTSEVLKNAFVLLRDRQLRRITLCIRGSSSIKDFCTSFTAVPMEFTARDSDDKPVVGYAHLGATLASWWLYDRLRGELEAHLSANPGWTLQLTGHSIGVACASLLSMR
ncbi:hypothetical protein GPECTOR_50g607 [Gonium pectorale]|uniref:Fungal lipase-type domain-containing protein n=1 Tax=Gonium pectorale TaxID=33097 RepID=A0A150G7R3_GONPE|nr:hypothetical protein GPECTOR_50g607 [Gonium pectorale]|eukprot:KXZ45813.1 hypothetical protein GPECTOR_50g607 [Gonium pectorale]